MAGILGYFASPDANDQLTAKAGGQIVAYRLPSYGSFSATAQPHYWYGIVRSVSFPGVSMDVDRIAMHVEAKDGDKQQKLAYMKQVGTASSAFEHAVPERMFADPNKPLDDPSQPQGISAVKAIAIAASQGQKIYTLTAHNAAYHANILASLNTNENTKTEIRNALSAGMEVTVHQADITVNGWTGSGYIILDPETGAGAYKISGGMNGGWMLGFIQGAALGLVLVMASLLAAAAISGGLWTIWIPIALIIVANVIITLSNINSIEDELLVSCYLNGMFAGLGVAGLFRLNEFVSRIPALFGIVTTISVNTTAGRRCGS